MAGKEGAVYCFRAVHIADFEESRAGEAAVVVDRRGPVRPHCLPFVLRVDMPVAFDLGSSGALPSSPSRVKGREGGKAAGGAARLALPDPPRRRGAARSTSTPPTFYAR